MSFSYNTGNVKPTVAGGYEPIPDGKYLLRINGVKEQISNNGDPQVVVHYLVADGPYKGRRISYHYVTFMPEKSKGAGIAIHFLKSIGEPFEGALNIDASRWSGKLLYANIGSTEYNGKSRNKVLSIEPCKEEPLPF